jgi:hypothetical protein
MPESEECPGEGACGQEDCDCEGSVRTTPQDVLDILDELADAPYVYHPYDHLYPRVQQATHYIQQGGSVSGWTSGKGMAPDAYRTKPPGSAA